MNKKEKCTAAKDIIHLLYNDFAETKNNEFNDMKKVLLNVYKQLDSSNGIGVTTLIERLVKYLYWTTFNKKIHLTPEQESLIRKLSDIGKTAGLNGAYSGFRYESNFD